MIVSGRVRLTAAVRALPHRNYRLFFFGQLISQTGRGCDHSPGLAARHPGRLESGVLYIGLLGVVQFLRSCAWASSAGSSRHLAQTQDGSRNPDHVRPARAHPGPARLLPRRCGLARLRSCVPAGTGQRGGHADPPVVRHGNGGRRRHRERHCPQSAVFNGARIVGPAIAGVLISLVGTALCFILNGLSYGAVVFGLLAMHEADLMPAPRLEMPRNLTAVRSNLGEGLHYVRHTPVVLLVLAVGGFVGTFA